jgi:SAM-dependent methyltransferase
MATINSYLKSAGISVRTFFDSLRGVPKFLDNYKELKRQLPLNNLFPISSMNPQLSDRFENAGSLPLHYFHQDLYVAKQIYKNNPVKHVDVGSRIDGFVAHIAIFREVEVFDIRNLGGLIPGVKFVQADLMSTEFTFRDYTDSVSSLHAIEHFGLGRYGDKIDVNGYLKGLNNIYQLLKPGGRFYFSVPIGPQRIEFDAHRVFSVKYLLELFKDKYRISSFSYIDDNNNFFADAALDTQSVNNDFNCTYGCGIFVLEKL